MGIRSVNLAPSKLFSALKLPSRLPIIECHRDEVWELPPYAEVMAWSDKTRVEMFRYGDHIMGIQGHPEYTKDVLLNIADRLLHRNLIQVESHCPRRSATTHQPSFSYLADISVSTHCKCSNKFMMSGVPSRSGEDERRAAGAGQRGVEETV
uniref:Glutamine amidotransferase domain-containing protein n=1 Tax=Nelumbo nucifera TaxID=4432 RepID=A0A822Z8L3_NELNU|nr:TPA_asm: hypothetical protein HUJ06_015226 [Nelumbo nucifera]